MAEMYSTRTYVQHGNGDNHSVTNWQIMYLNRS